MAAYALSARTNQHLAAQVHGYHSGGSLSRSRCTCKALERSKLSPVFSQPENLSTTSVWQAHSNRTSRQLEVVIHRLQLLTHFCGATPAWQESCGMGVGFQPAAVSPAVNPRGSKV